MNKKSIDYLEEVVDYVKSKEAKRYVAAELRYHLEQEKQNFIKSGMKEGDAEEAAIKQMGSPNLLGTEMNKLHRPKIDWVMIGLVLLISIIGLLPTLHVSEEWNNENGYFIRKIILLIVSLIISLSLMFYDYRNLFKLKWLIYGSTILILCSLTMFPHFYINGAAHFMIARLSIDSTVAVTALVICWMVYLGSLNAGFWKSFILVGVSIFSLMLIPSLSAVFVFIATITVLMCIRFKRNRKHIASLYLGIPVIGAIFILTQISNIQPYQLERMNAYLHPEEFKSSSGYMYIRNHELLTSGGWFGEDDGMEVISEPHTNFAFTTIIYHYGWLAGIVLLSTAVFIMYRMLFHIRTVKDRFGQIIIIGGLTLFASQFLYNIGMIIGFFPLTGMSLPFVSYGLNPTIQMSVMIGLILSVYRRKDLQGIWNQEAT